MEILSTFFEQKLKSAYMEKQDEILENTFLLVMGLYLFQLFMRGTTFGVNFPECYEWMVRIAATGLGLLRIQRHPIRSKYATTLLILCGLGCVLPFLKTGYAFMLDIPIYIMGCYAMDYKKVLKVYLLVGTSVLAAGIFGVFLGVTQDLVYLRTANSVGETNDIFNRIFARVGLPIAEEETIVRHSMGVMYCTDFAAWCLSLSLAFWIYFEKIPSLVFSVIFFLMGYMVNTVAGARNGAAVFLLASVAAFLCTFLEVLGKIKCIRKLLNPLCGVAAAMASPIGAILIYILMFKIRDPQTFQKMNQLLSNRLTYSQAAYGQHGITWLGSFFEMLGNGGNDLVTRETLTFIDISYVLLFIRYGILFSLVLMMVYAVVGVRASRCGNYRIPIVICIFAVQGLMEHYMAEHAYMILLMLPLAVLGEKGKKQVGFIEYLFCLVMIGGTCCYVLAQISVYRGLLGFFEEKGKDIFLISFLLVIALLTVGCALLHKKKWFGVILSLVSLAVILLVPTIWIQTKEDENIEELLVAGGIFEVLMEEKKEANFQVFSDQNTYFHEKQWENLDTSLMLGNGLAGQKDAVVLTRRNQDLYILNNMGYVYAPITEHYGIYTNSQEAKDILNREGYAVSGVYNEVTEMELEQVQSAMGISATVEGSLRLSGQNSIIYFGPIEVVNGDKVRTVQVDIRIDTEHMKALGTKPFSKITITSVYEKIQIESQSYMVKDISEDGVISLVFRKFYNEEYYIKLENLNGSEFSVESVQYYKVN